MNHDSSAPQPRTVTIPLRTAILISIFIAVAFLALGLYFMPVEEVISNLMQGIPEAMVGLLALATQVKR